MLKGRRHQTRSVLAFVASHRSRPLQARIAMLVNSVPLSETHVVGLPRTAMMASSSRATRAPESEVSATSARLAHLVSRARVSHGLPFSDGRQHFPKVMSFRIALSGIVSASSFFSFAFSSSSAFSRLASDTSMPSNFDFHL